MSTLSGSNGLGPFTDPAPLLRLALALFYAGALVFMYEELSYRWSYFGFVWANPTAWKIQVAILLAALPALFLPRTASGLQGFAAWILQTLIFTPSIALPLLQGFQPDRDYQVAAIICLSASVFNWISRIPAKPFPETRLLSFSREYIVIVALVVLIAFLVYVGVVHWNSLELTSFDQVYDQRSEFSASATVIDLYLMPNVANVLVPFLFVVGIHSRKPLLIPLALLGTLLVYAAFALKSVILAPVLILGIYFLFDTHGKIRIGVIPLGLGVLSLIFAPFVSTLTGGPLWGLTNLLFMRTLTLPGVIVGLFSSFFSTYQWTYYSHSLVGRYFFPYPYGGYSVGQIVGLYLFPDQGDPFELNGSFVATDGLAALGTLGVPISFVVTALALRILAKAAAETERRVAFAMAVPFLMTLANTSVFSSMVTGGGLGLAGLLYLWGSTLARERAQPLSDHSTAASSFLPR